MTVMTNVVLVLKDSEGNIGIVKTLTDNDIIKIANAITDVGQVVDPATHMPIEATKTSAGVVQLATAQDITNGTAGKVVDAQELNNFAQTLPAANGVTDVSSGDNSNQLVVSRIGGSKTLTIDNVEHAAQADTATSANSVAWNNVSGKPTKVSQFTNDSNYLTGITKAMVTAALGYTPPTSDTNTWNALKGSTTSAAGTAGYAPAPAAGAANRYLRCDGTWQVPPDNNTTYSVATTSANGLMSSSDKTKLNKCITTDSIWVG